MLEPRKGGSFAPPLTEETIKKYRVLAESAPAQVKDGMGVLLVLACEHRKHPESAAVGTPHPSGRGVMVPLAVAVADAIDPFTPWDDELRMFGDVFGRIDSVEHKELRDAAHHLLWYAKELSLGREPITTDKL